jgi:hypothetical protein
MVDVVHQLGVLSKRIILGHRPKQHSSLCLSVVIERSVAGQRKLAAKLSLGNLGKCSSKLSVQGDPTVAWGLQVNLVFGFHFHYPIRSPVVVAPRG